MTPTKRPSQAHPGQGLNRAERLKSYKQIRSLFSDGQSAFLFPYKIMYQFRTDALSGSPAQVAFSVPKRRFSRAVDRQRIKRQMREAYRHHKHILYDHVRKEAGQLALMIIFSGKEILDTAFMEKRMIAILKQLVSRLDKKS